MQNVRWLTFCVSNAITRSVVHFFPASVSVAAPYAANCKLTLFGKGIESKSVALDGARFGQPDGVRLDDVFPQLQEGTNGFFGLEFEITTPQPRTDLSASSCIIELASRGQSCRFWPRRFIEDADAAARGMAPVRTAAQRSMLAIKDAFCTSSLVLVNGSSEAYTPSVSAALVDEKEPAAIAIESLAPHSIVEVEIGELLESGQTPQECAWGLVRTGALWMSAPMPEQVVCYVMYRDAVTRRPLSVVSL